MEKMLTVMQSRDARPITQILPYGVNLPDAFPAGTEQATRIPSKPSDKHLENPSSKGRFFEQRTAAPLLPVPGRKIIHGQPRALALPSITESEDDALSDPILREQSPWDNFKRYYECDLAGAVIVSVRHSGHREALAVRQYRGEEASKILQVVRRIQHDNIASVQEFYKTTNALYTVGSFHPLTLDHVVACKAFPDQKQLAAIMSQFLEGYSYLVTHGFQNPSLDCSGILMSMAGDVQVARLDCCRVRPPGKVEAIDLAPIARVMMELMQKYAKDDGNIGIENLDRWPSDCPAVVFLSATTSVGSFEELKKVFAPIFSIKPYLHACSNRL
ncbi:hypothetical protein BO82DRAFT_426160 [Aspergillus uvarum CBS 121591]|uniref:Protein kinase domain-containing protein n=1 Tax=Aspergillus uvarum CBS 121591 TaxID=1448315 RepID=A0A319BW10_9EURO|nr:hypothetical protein BO82DRAFT_426160 [Aspergillus uvarum CBS 121591]PYH76417.1 hypothetical protein BO82DRAFT_426160 [Aspergillus uvarum CBS 121591]